MQGSTPVPVVEELAGLVERAERACRTTAQLVRNFNFIVVWYQSRPRSRLRADAILDETSDHEQTQDSPCDPSISQEYSLSNLNAPEHRVAHPRAPSVRA